jgi:hypothetical protein
VYLMPCHGEMEILVCLYDSARTFFQGQ